MIARIRIVANEWPGSDGVVVDRTTGAGWGSVGYYDLHDRDISVEFNAGDRLRIAGFRRGDVPQGAPAGVTAFLLGDFVEVPLG